MSTELEMGRVVAAATVENLEDLWRCRRGDLTPAEIRRIEIPEALVDTGATTLCLPQSLIESLGLLECGTRRSMSSAGPRMTRIFGPVKLTVQGRDCNVDVLELPDGVPPLIGQIPLEMLDFVVDPPGRRLIGNPQHGGEQMLEMY
jgi:predicted aspartyl protease